MEMLSFLSAKLADQSTPISSKITILKYIFPFSDNQNAANIETIIPIEAAQSSYSLISHTNPELKFHAVSLIANLTFFRYFVISIITNASLLSLLHLLQSSQQNIVQSALIAIGNIACEGDDFRLLLLSNGVIKRIKDIFLQKDITISTASQVAWTIGHLCNTNNSPKKEEIEQLYPILSDFLACKEMVVTKSTLFTTYTIIKYNTKQYYCNLVNKQLLKVIIELLESKENDILLVAICIVASLAMDDSYISILCECKCVEKLKLIILTPNKSSILRSSISALSNIVVSAEAVEKMISLKIVDDVLLIMKKCELEIKKEGIYFFHNILEFSNREQIRYMISAKIYEFYIGLLSTTDEIECLLCTLYALKQIFSKGNDHNKNLFVDEFEALNGFSMLDRLAWHSNIDVFRQSQNILTLYYADKKDESS
jgi:hypothetical protein